jgi:Tol biopolymer transport system component
MTMSRLDDVLTRELERVASPAQAEPVPEWQQVTHRYARHRIRRRVGVAALAGVVILGSVATFAGFQRMFAPGGAGAATGAAAVSNGEIAYSVPNPQTGDMDIVVMHADGTAAQVLNQPGDDYSPRWSPDGTRILYWKDGVGIFTMASDGTDVQKISDVHSVFSLSWSPDGSTVAYAALVPGSPPDGFAAKGTASGDVVSVTAGITLMNPDGSDVRSLEIAGNPWIETGPSWSPDGARFAFSGGTGVWIANADGTAAHEISQDGWGPAWSPDGSVIAFSTRNGVRSIAPDGSGMRTLTSEPGLAYRDVTFSPDGSTILFTAEPDVQQGLQNYDVFSMRPDGSDVQQLTHLAGDDVGSCCLDPSWQPMPAPSR